MGAKDPNPAAVLFDILANMREGTPLGSTFPRHERGELTRVIEADWAERIEIARRMHAGAARMGNVTKQCPDFGCSKPDFGGIKRYPDGW